MEAAKFYRCHAAHCTLADSGALIPARAAADAEFRCLMCRAPLAPVETLPADDVDAPQDLAGPINWPAGLEPAALPTYLAHPWAATWQEGHPRARLDALIDTAEVVVRWSVAFTLAEVVQANGGQLPESVFMATRDQIERPTLGQWLGILRVLSSEQPQTSLLAGAELFGLYDAVMAPAFRSETEGGTEADSFLVLRNRIVHGGGLSSRRAQALFDAHHERLQQLLQAVVKATPGLAVIALEGGAVRRLQGLVPESVEIPEALRGAEDGPWLVSDRGVLPLLPLLGFGPVRRVGPDGQLAVLPGSASAQVYTRSQRQRLAYTPLGRDEAQSEVLDVAAFRALFHLDEPRPGRGTPIDAGYRWDDFLRTARLEAEALVGRQTELAQVKAWLKGRNTQEEGIAMLGWLQGAPGVGKSVLMARLAADAANAPIERQGVFYHRFQGGDARNHRRVFLRFLQAALAAWPPLAAVTEPPSAEIDEGTALEDDIKARLAAIAALPAPRPEASPPRFLIFVDGLDEVVTHNRTLPNLLKQLALPGAVWLLAGRAEQGLSETFSGPGCEALFSGDGLPGMSADDIRAMLLEGLDSARRQLLARDIDLADDQVRNPFVERVVECAHGLPLYVYHVVEDLRAGQLTVQDEDRLPEGLIAYYDAFMARAGLSTVKRDLPLIVCLLARAEEPLDAEALALLMAERPERLESYRKRTQAALRGWHALFRQAPTPDGSEGYILHHQSFKEYIGGRKTSPDGPWELEPAPALHDVVEEAEERLYTLAGHWAVLPEGNLRNHLFRWGVEYALWWQGEAGVKVAHARLTDFVYLQARLAALPASEVTDLVHEYALVLERLAQDEEKTPFQIWEAFFRENAHLLRRGNTDWPSNKILLQLAVEHADNSPVTQAAEAWLEAGHCDWLWLRNARRPSHAGPSYCLRVFEGHSSGVRGAQVLADGRILSWSWDGTLRLWSDQGVALAILEGHSNGVRGAEVLADGRMLSWSLDGTLRLWSDQGEALAVLEGHGFFGVFGGVNGAQVLADGRILSWSDDGTLRLWSAQGEALVVLEGHTDSVVGAQVLADGRILSWSDDGTLRLWSAQGEALVVLEGHTDSVVGAQVLADGRIFSWSSDGNLRLWSDEGEALVVLEGHTGSIEGIQVFADGRLLSWSVDGTLRLWSAQGEALATLEEHSDSVDGAHVLADGRILSWSWDGTLRLGSDRGETLALFEGQGGSEDGVQVFVLADGRILSKSADGALRLWSDQGEALATLEGHSDSVEGAQVLADGRFLSWYWNGTLRLWSDQGETLVAPEGHTDWVYGAHVLDDGRMLSWSLDGTLRLWSDQGEALAVLEGHSNGVRGAEVLADGRMLSWSLDGTLRLWSDQGEALAVLEGHSNGVRGAEVLADGRIISWSRNGVRLWSDQGKPLATLEGRDDGLASVQVLAGRILVRSNHGALQLWSDQGEILATLDGHSDSVKGAQVLADGRILSWSWDGTLRLWSDQGEVLATLEGQCWLIGAELLADGRVLSWSSGGTLRCWSDEGKMLDVIAQETAAVQSPHLFLAWKKAIAEETVCQGCIGGVTGKPRGILLHLAIDHRGPTVFWYTSGLDKVHTLLPDESLVASLENGQVVFLKLYHGKRRVSLAETREILGLPQWSEEEDRVSSVS